MADFIHSAERELGLPWKPDTARLLPLGLTGLDSRGAGRVAFGEWALGVLSPEQMLWRGKRKGCEFPTPRSPSLSQGSPIPRGLPNWVVPPELPELQVPKQA